MKKIAILIVLLGIVSIGFDIKGQTAPGLPQREGVVLSPVMNMSFGDFFPTDISNSYIDLFPNNTVVPSGVVRFNNGRSTNPAMFEFKLCPGRSITIYYNNTYVAYNSSYQMTVELSPAYFMIDGGTIDEQGAGYIKFTSNKGCNDIHRIYVGGRIKVNARNSNPEGYYNGNLQLTIVQQ